MGTNQNCEIMPEKIQVSYPIRVLVLIVTEYSLLIF